MIGLSLGMLTDGPLEESLDLFGELRSVYDLDACEIQGESSLYNSSCEIGNNRHINLISALRREVRKLGVHLPFMGLHPLSTDRSVRKECMSIFFDWIDFAAGTGADYAVLHLRKGSVLSNGCPGNSEIAEWQSFLDDLSARAYEKKIDICIENADDMRFFDDISQLADNCKNPAKLCLDIGHLHERIYSGPPLVRKMMQLNDMLSPKPFAIRRNLPEKESGGWVAIIESMKDKIGAVHLHNHDGRMAHKPLINGKIDFSPLRNLAESVREIPMVIESDYRSVDRDTIKRDIEMLEELLGNGK